MRNWIFKLALCSVCWWPVGVGGQEATDAGKPQVVRKSEDFVFKGGTLEVFREQVQKEFGISPDHFRPIRHPLLFTVIVPKLQVKAQGYINVLQHYNGLSEKDPRMGRWLLPAGAPGTTASSQIVFARDAVRPDGKFDFEGGSLFDFVNAIDLQFAVDLDNVATIPNSVREVPVEVPKMRLRTDDYAEVLDLYNEISREMDYSLGRWIVKKTRDEVSAVVLMPPPRSNQSDGFGTRAFSFMRTEPDALNKLRETIEMQARILQNFRRNGERPRGDIAYHEATKIVVVTGTPSYLELASEIIGASRGQLGQTTDSAPAKKF